jgi:SnoaL-like protein
MPTRSQTADKLAIRELIENWAIFRDGLMWDRFRTVWHKDGQMWATWFQGSAEEFIEVSKKGYANGVRVFHQLSGSSIDVIGKRAIAMTKMTITQRGKIDGAACDVICAGRFYDFLEKRKGQWGLVLRRLIYEMDRLVPIEPSAAIKLDKAILERFPVGYRHLAYLQVKGGFNVKSDLPGTDGPAVDALYAKGADWLKGKKI